MVIDCGVDGMIGILNDRLIMWGFRGGYRQ